MTIQDDTTLLMYFYCRYITVDVITVKHVKLFWKDAYTGALPVSEYNIHMNMLTFHFDPVIAFLL